MKATHTKGPWVVAPCSNYANGSNWRDINSIGGEFSPSYVGEALEKDAEFIVLACNAHEDLLAACELALGQLEGINPKGGVHSSSLQADIRIIREALARARGERGDGK